MMLENLQRGSGFVRMEIFNEAEKSLKKINDNIKTENDPKERRRLRKEYNKQVKLLVDQLDEVPEE